MIHRFLPLEPVRAVRVIILVFCEVHVVFSSSSLSGLDSLNGCEGFSELRQLASWLHGRCLCSLAFACLWSGWVGESLYLSSSSTSTSSSPLDIARGGWGSCGGYGCYIG